MGPRSMVDGIKGMGVTVRLYASLREGRKAEEEVETSPGTTVATLAAALGLPQSAVTLVFVNNRHGSWDTVLHDGDEIALFPPVGGG
jgi:sulfur-carrier protein